MMNSSASGKVSGHRSAFSQTVNLLSQYVKEKKAMGDFSLGMFGNTDEQGQNDAFRPTTMNLFPVNKNSTEKEMDLFPQQTSFASQSSESQSSQLTIFYAGQVIVVNDFPAHKAKEIMEFANKGVSQKSNTKNMNEFNQQIQECSQQTTKPIVADLPIARKASLHRFLEKRKDRIKAKAPYNTSKGGDVPMKVEENISWLGLAAAPVS